MKIDKICKECGRRNSRVRFKKKFKKTLCETCYKTYKDNPVKYIPPAGEIHFDSEGKLICHICGRSYDKLTIHILCKHKLGSSEYKEKFQLNRTQSLVSEKLKEVYRKNKNLENIHLYRKPLGKGNNNAKKPRRLQYIKKVTGIKRNTYKINQIE